jgi:hypothetical protein
MKKSPIDHEVELLEKACDAAFAEARRERELKKESAQFLHKEHMGILALLRATNLRLRRIEARLAGENMEAVEREHEALGAFSELAELTEPQKPR